MNLFLPLAFVLASCASCAFPGPQPLETVPPAASPAARVEPASAPQEPARLYARDGTVVTPQSAPREPAPLAQREMQGSEGSRYHMLELYQQVVDERDALSGEVRRLSAEVSAARARNLLSEQRLAELEKSHVERGLELERVQADNVELAGRLTTAQIRRLQAEKLLLESRLEATRARNAAQSAPAPESTTAVPPRTGER